MPGCLVGASAGKDVMLNSSLRPHEQKRPGTSAAFLRRSCRLVRPESYHAEQIGIERVKHRHVRRGGNHAVLGDGCGTLLASLLRNCGSYCEDGLRPQCDNWPFHFKGQWFSNSQGDGRVEQSGAEHVPDPAGPAGEAAGRFIRCGCRPPTASARELPMHSKNRANRFLNTVAQSTSPCQQNETGELALDSRKHKLRKPVRA